MDLRASQSPQKKMKNNSIKGGKGGGKREGVRSGSGLILGSRPRQNEPARTREKIRRKIHDPIKTKG